MKVSFLVTFYNQEKYVKRCIESIIAIKKNFDWELLVGDDGSTDNTRALVKEYISKFPSNISLYCMDRNDGVKEIVKRSSRNRINLLKYMTGDYFCIIDGDDYYCCDDFLELAISVYKDYPETSVVAFGYQRVTDIDNNIIDQNVIKQEGRMDYRTYLLKYYTPAGACVFKNIFSNSIMTQVSEIGFYDDNDIVLLNLNYGELYNVPKIIHSYVQNINSTYNSMNIIEQAVLNFQGWDVGRIYLDRGKEYVLRRYLSSVMLVILLIIIIEKTLGDKVYEYYKESESIPGSYTKLILGYKINSFGDNCKLACFIIGMIIKFPISFIKTIFYIIKLFFNKIK